MNRKNILKWGIFLSFLIISSILVHEGVHFLQSLYDPRVKAIGLTFILNDTTTIPHISSPAVAIIYKWTTDNEKEQQKFNKNIFWMEAEAYGVQFLYSTILTIIYLLKYEKN
jgi:hypothetical protein